MGSRLTEIVVDCHDPAAQAAFWAAALVPEAKTVKNRLHLDLRPVGGSHQAEVERLIGLGARPADIGQGEVPWVVLADPEGNEFCVLGSLEAVT
jgi:hypothetical protein